MNNIGRAWMIAVRYAEEQEAKATIKDIKKVVRSNMGKGFSGYRIWSLEDECWYVVVVAPNGSPIYDARVALAKVFKKTGGEERALSPETLAKLLERHHQGKVTIDPTTIRYEAGT